MSKIAQKHIADIPDLAKEAALMAAPQDELDFVPCRVYFKDSFHAGNVNRASFDPVRDNARYNPKTGIIRADIGGPWELSISGGWGAAVQRVKPE